MPPEQLIEALAGILGYQSEIIEAQGGRIEQFVGDCILAYWMPAEVATMFRMVRDASRRIVSEKTKVPRLTYHLRVTFSIAELAGAVFGSGSVFRFQVIGKARSRAENLPRLSLRKDYVLTDGETIRVMPMDAQNEFETITPTVYSLRLA